MDILTLETLIPEISRRLSGRKVGAAASTGEKEVLLHFGKGLRLLLSWDAINAGLFLPPADAFLPSAPTPLAEILDNRIRDAVLTGATLPIPGDRVVELTFSAPWPRKGEGPRLVIEVMGTRSNILLLDPAGRILASARTLSPAKNPKRPLRPGGLWSPPPPPTGEALRRHETPRGPAEHPPISYPDRPSVSSGKPELTGTPENPLPGLLLRLRGKLTRDLENLREEEERCRNFEKVRLKGETLLIHLAEIPVGAERVLLPHPSAPETALEILLSPAISPQDNARRIFDLARRLERGSAEAGLRKRKGEEALRAAENALVALEKGDEGPARSLLGLGGKNLRQAAAPRGRSGPGRAYEKDGFTILVGKGAADNDRVTFEAAGPSDLWLHARDYLGSHVVILSGGKSVPEAVVLYAAGLCAGKSGAKKDTAVEVMVAERKWVRKMKGEKPGKVRVERSRTVLAKRKKGEEWPK